MSPPTVIPVSTTRGIVTFYALSVGAMKSRRTETGIVFRIAMDLGSVSEQESDPYGTDSFVF